MINQRRFKLTIALKIIYREKNKIFIVENAKNEEINLIIIDDETNEITKKKTNKRKNILHDFFQANFNKKISHTIFEIC